MEKVIKGFIADLFSILNDPEMSDLDKLNAIREYLES
jgi:hypothetical protein